MTTSKGLSRADYERAAAELGCSLAAIMAVAEVESPRGGFNPDGSLTSLFEAHHFHRYTRGRFTPTHPNLSSPTWNRALYGRTWQAERKRLSDAMMLDPTAALLSTSFGRFQMMGFNFAIAGYTTVQGMVNAFQEGEGAQLDAFVDFIRTRGLADEMQTLELPASQLNFALVYNGPRARENKYDIKIARALHKYQQMGL